MCMYQLPKQTIGVGPHTSRGRPQRVPYNGDLNHDRGHFPRTATENHPPTASERIIESLNIESTQDRELSYPTGSKFWFTITSLCLVLILGGLDANIVATAVPGITNHFHTVADVGWYSSAFRLCTCAFQFGFAKL
ncbi:Major facilitator superfamily domain general substrate transporter [Penicillium cf. griseofulvum]|uniref:Major facilitator superfamily domain general substrate transporter n=1 Tax=Penicillium cf. griseofulvum TaxID=2972120 RepID=A0A9W9MR97_9EURO|nr:Major facilitator superfamily domain general substrate transporter [Penicillium cf. griseofulvum]